MGTPEDVAKEKHFSPPYIHPSEFQNAMGVTILVGKHKDEVGVVVGKSSDHIQVLTLEGDTHYYETWEIKRI